MKQVSTTYCGECGQKLIRTVAGNIVDFRHVTNCGDKTK